MAEPEKTRIGIQLGVCELSVSAGGVSRAIKISLRAGSKIGIETGRLSDLDTLLRLSDWLEAAQCVVQEALDTQELVAFDEMGRIKR